MPSSLATSGTVAPPASLASASRSLRTICSGECRLPIESPPSSALEWLDSHSSWISFRGAGQRPFVSGLAVSKVEAYPGSRSELAALWRPFAEDQVYGYGGRRDE